MPFGYKFKCHKSLLFIGLKLTMFSDKVNCDVFFCLAFCVSFNLIAIKEWISINRYNIRLSDKFPLEYICFAYIFMSVSECVWVSGIVLGNVLFFNKYAFVYQYIKTKVIVFFIYVFMNGKLLIGSQNKECVNSMAGK